MAAEVGKIKIGTELVTDKFDRQIVDLEKKMQDAEDKKIEIEAELKVKDSSLGKLREQAKPILQQMQSLKKQIEEIELKPSVSAGEAFQYDQLVNQYNELTRSYNVLQRQANGLLTETQKLNKEYTDISNKVGEYKQKIEGIKIQKQTQGAQEFSKSLKDAVKSAGKLVLGIFGIISAYMALRSASSNLATYDEQYAADLEYIRYVLTQAIAPVLRGILQLAMNLLKYINMIVSALFGVNLFSKGSAESFQKMKAGANGVSKAVKELKKQLTGFDEINMLTDQSDTGTSAGAGGVTPSMDLSNLEGEPPKWMDWLIKNKDLVVNVLKAIGAALIGLKIADVLKSLGLLGEGFSTFKTLLLGLAIGTIIFGIWQTIEAIINFVKNPTWENFAKILEGLAITLAGIAGLLIVINASNPIGWIILLVAAIVGLVGLLIENFDAVKAFFVDLWEFIVGNFQRHWQVITMAFDIFANFVKTKVIDPVTKFFKGMWDSVSKGAMDVWQRITSTFEKVVGFFKDKFTAAWNSVKNIFSKGGSIFSGIVNGISDTFKRIVNNIIDGINSVVAVPFKAINSALNKLKNVEILDYKPFSWMPSIDVPKIPKLAVGGIVNMPNRGTLVGGAIAGESGQEGVIPLTDQQAMETLGEAIGRYITINANIVNKMNGRTLSREMVQIKNEQDFAYNS